MADETSFGATQAFDLDKLTTHLSEHLLFAWGERCVDPRINFVGSKDFSTLGSFRRKLHELAQSGLIKTQIRQDYNLVVFGNVSKSDKGIGNIRLETGTFFTESGDSIPACSLELYTYAPLEFLGHDREIMPFMLQIWGATNSRDSRVFF